MASRCDHSSTAYTSCRCSGNGLCLTCGGRSDVDMLDPGVLAYPVVVPGQMPAYTSFARCSWSITVTDGMVCYILWQCLPLFVWILGPSWHNLYQDVVFVVSVLPVIWNAMPRILSFCIVWCFQLITTQLWFPFKLSNPKSNLPYAKLLHPVYHAFYWIDVMRLSWQAFLALHHFEHKLIPNVLYPEFLVLRISWIEHLCASSSYQGQG